MSERPRPPDEARVPDYAEDTDLAYDEADRPRYADRPADRPEDEGIPDHAVDTSTAYDDADRPRFDDSPPPLPADSPQAVDEFGITGAEGREGEPLGAKLDREEPDVGIGGPGPARDSLGEPDRGDGGPGRVPDEPDPTTGEEPPARIGRLVEPDQGARADDEKDMIAYDAGEAGGGLSAEEAAMHEVSGDEVPYESR